MAVIFFMNNLIPLHQEVNKCIVHDFDLTKEDFNGLIEIDQIKKKLTSILQYLLDKDLNKLLNIFYRIDLDERKVKLILSASNPDQIAGDLAELVIQRELQKATTRLKYRDIN
jgi:hypothetical protein